MNTDNNSLDFSDDKEIKAEVESIIAEALVIACNSMIDDIVNQVGAENITPELQEYINQVKSQGVSTEVMNLIRSLGADVTAIPELEITPHTPISTQTAEAFQRAASAYLNNLKKY